MNTNTVCICLTVLTVGFVCLCIFASLCYQSPSMYWLSEFEYHDRTKSTPLFLFPADLYYWGNHRYCWRWFPVRTTYAVKWIRLQYCVTFSGKERRRRKKSSRKGVLSADANIYLSAEVTGCWAILWQLTAAVWLFSAVCETNLTTEHHFTTGTQWFVFKSVICIVLAAFGGQLGRLACFHWSYLWKIRTHIHTDDEGDCGERRIQCLLSHTVNFELCGRNINPANDNKPRHSHYTVSVYRLSILIIACTVNSAPSKFFLLTLSPGTLIKSSLHW